MTYVPPEEPYTEDRPEVPDDERCQFMILASLRCARRREWYIRVHGHSYKEYCAHHADLLNGLMNEAQTTHSMGPLVTPTS